MSIPKDTADFLAFAEAYLGAELTKPQRQVAAMVAAGGMDGMNYSSARVHMREYQRRWAAAAKWRHGIRDRLTQRISPKLIEALEQIRKSTDGGATNELDQKSQEPPRRIPREPNPIDGKSLPGRP